MEHFTHLQDLFHISMKGDWTNFLSVTFKVDQIAPLPVEPVGTSEDSYWCEG